MTVTIFTAIIMFSVITYNTVKVCGKTTKETIEEVKK